MDAEFSKLPNLSPYGYVNNNPLLFIDPDGNFLIDVHKRITSMAFAHSKLIQTTKNYQVVEKYRKAIVGYGLFDGSVAAPDKRSLPWPIGGGQESVHKEHFDSMNYTQIIANFQRINKNIDDLMGIYSKKLIDSESLGNSIGEDFHAVQDFYSHSNFIELYEKVYGQTELSKIPTLQDALSQKEHKKFAALLKKELKTGEYPGEGEGSHKKINHDLGKGSAYEKFDFVVEEVKGKDVNWFSRAAEEVATKATKQLNDKIESKL